MPCCCLVNPPILIPAGNPGDLTITRGTGSHYDEGMINYAYKYSTGAMFIPATDLTTIPNNATINKIAFEYDLTLASGGTTYTVNNVSFFTYLHPTATDFPGAIRNTGYATTNNTYNNAIVNYTDVFNGTASYSFTQETIDANIRYVDIPFVNTMTYLSGHAIAIAIVNNSGAYTGTGSTPAWLGAVGAHSGQYFAKQNTDSGSGYTLGAGITIDQTFKPNIKIYWT